MAVTNKDPGVSQDLTLRVAISRGTAILSPELIEALQAVPDMLIASRVDPSHLDACPHLLGGG